MDGLKKKFPNHLEPYSEIEAIFNGPNHGKKI